MENKLNIMKFKLIKILMSLIILLCVFSFSKAQDIKIGFVSYERIIRDTESAKAATAKLEKEFSKREKDLRDLGIKLKTAAEQLDKDSPILSSSERTKIQRRIADLDKDFQRKQREFREDVNQRRNEELTIVVERANKAIKEIAEAEKIDIVFENAVYYSSRIDITNKVLKSLNK